MKEIIKELLEEQIHSLQEQSDILDCASIRLKTNEEFKFYYHQKLQVITALVEAEKQLELLEEKEKEKNNDKN